MNFQEDSLQAICSDNSPRLNHSVETEPTQPQKIDETHFNLDESVNFCHDCAFSFHEESQNVLPQENVSFLTQSIPVVICRKTLSLFITTLITQTNKNTDNIKRFVAIHSNKNLNLVLTEILVQKFKKLKKTKQQMIKYCMRKVFKFIMDLPHSQFLSKNSHLLEIDAKKQSFICNKNKIKFIKKISAQKSMNNAYLKNIFQKEGFKQDYELFLNEFDLIVEEDNRKKADYLVNLIMNHENDFQKFTGLRRLPWTNNLLTKVKNLARDLIIFSNLQ